MEQNITMHRNREWNGRRTIVGGLIAAHGAMHAFLLNTPRPDGGTGNFLTRGGEVPLGALGLGAGAIEALGMMMVLITAAGLMISALLYYQKARGWERCLIASSALSIATLVMFWNDWMVMGVVLSAGMILVTLRSQHVAEAGA
jgi:hypothetical protein